MPSLRLGEAEHRVVVGDDDVADRGQPGAAAERGAVDAADDARPAACSARGSIAVVRRASACVLLARVAGHPRHPGGVGAGAERPCRRPPRTTTRSAGVGGRARRPTRCSSAMTASLKALRTSGRLSVRYSTGAVAAIAEELIHASPTSGRRRSVAGGTGALARRRQAERERGRACRPDRGCRRPRAARWSSRATLRRRTSPGSDRGSRLRPRPSRAWPSRASWSRLTVVSTPAACSPPITEMRALGHIHSKRGS